MPTPDFTIKDSGKRQEFQGGMVRDTEDAKLDLTNLIQWFEPMGTRYAAHMTKGRGKYPDPKPGVPNWTLTDITPEAEQRFRRSASRHFKQWLNGETDEDHAAAVLFNINGAEYVRERLDRDNDDDRGPNEDVAVGEDPGVVAFTGTYPRAQGLATQALYGDSDEGVGESC